jgi:hypothetical protein
MPDPLLKGKAAQVEPLNWVFSSGCLRAEKAKLNASCACHQVVTPLHPPITPLCGSSLWNLPLLEHTTAFRYFRRSVHLRAAVLLGVWCSDHGPDIPFIWVGFNIRGFLRRPLLFNWPNRPLRWFPNQRRQRRLLLFRHLQRLADFGLDHNYPRIIDIVQSAAEFLLPHLEGTRVFFVFFRGHIPRTFVSGGDR